MTPFLQRNLKYILWVVIAYAVFLRFYKLWESSMWIDEGFSSYSSISGVNMAYYLHNLSQILSFNIFWISDWSARLPSVVFSVLTIPLVYLISQRLFADKHVSVIATLIYCFAYIEIVWARQARFYTLLQFLFYLSIYLNILWVQKFSYLKLALSLWVVYISIVFHPFLYVSAVIFLLSLSYKILTEYSAGSKNIFFKQIQSEWKSCIALMLMTVWVVWKYIYDVITTSQVTLVNISHKIPESFVESYINKYTLYLMYESGILYILFFIWLFYYAIKRNYLVLILFAGWFLLAFYAISQKWQLFHFRYVFFLFPLIYIVWVHMYFILWDAIKNKIWKYTYFSVIWILITLSLHSSIIPKSYLEIDYTSPQVDFKSAYKSLPSGAQIISWFPMLCEWYYSERWDCVYSLAVNYVGTSSSEKKTLERWMDNYTQLAYLDEISLLDTSVEYYFVLDALTLWGMIESNLRNKILENWEIVYNEGQSYKNIKIIKLIR